MEEYLWSLIPWGYLILLNIEAVRTNFLNAVFPIITDLGHELFYIVLITLVYWSVNKSVGQGLAYAYTFTVVLYSWIKGLFAIPRPGELDLETTLIKAGISPRLTVMRQVPGHAFVSGHAQASAVVWGYLAYHFKKTWFWVLAIILVMLISFSRMYLGVHFPQDVIGGLIIGIIYLILWLLFEPYIRTWLSNLRPLWKFTLVLVERIAVTL